MPEETTVPIRVGDVLEDANGYCLYVALVNEATFTVYDFPEQVIEPCLYVIREIRNVPNITDFFVVRLPTRDETVRLQRAFGVTADGIIGPRTVLEARLSHDADTDPPEEDVGLKVPTRFERDED